MVQEKFSMPLLGDVFPEIEVQTTHGPMKIPADLKGSWFVLFSHVASFLQQNGYTKVYSLAGGTFAWSHAGYELVS